MPPPPTHARILAGKTHRGICGSVDGHDSWRVEIAATAAAACSRDVGMPYELGSEVESPDSATCPPYPTAPAAAAAMNAGEDMSDELGGGCNARDSGDEAKGAALHGG